MRVIYGFLGKPIPDASFQKVNEAVTLNEKLALIVRRGLMNGLKRAFMVLVPGFVLRLAWWLSRLGQSNQNLHENDYYHYFR